MRIFSVKNKVKWRCAFPLKAHVIISEFLGVCNSSSEFLCFLLWGLLVRPECWPSCCFQEMCATQPVSATLIWQTHGTQSLFNNFQSRSASIFRGQTGMKAFWYIWHEITVIFKIIVEIRLLVGLSWKWPLSFFQIAGKTKKVYWSN